MSYTQDQKEAFYQELDKLPREAPKDNKILLLENFKARVGRDHHSWPGVPGHH